jgi:Family of unknown function (DUF5724)/Domain of unknown function (DUF4132)
MLNPEFAQARLKEYKVDDWLKTRLQSFKKLSPELSKIGCGVFGYDEKGQEIKSDNTYILIEQRIHELGELASVERLKIFKIIVPKFADVFEAAWQSFRGLTYQTGYSRRSFRAPDLPQCYGGKRSAWFQSTLSFITGYDEDLPWLAAWCPYLGYYGDTLGYLFAAAIDQGGQLGDEVFSILIASAKGEHEIGAMGRHVTRSLLLANCPDGWEFVEKLLIAAQRQEGLRQVILESVDEAHPVAYQRMLQLILDENLIRFTATLRAVDVWFGFNLEVLNEKEGRRIVGQFLELLTDQQKHQNALQSDDAQTVYLALFVTGFSDATKSIGEAQQLLTNPKATHRFIAVYFLMQLGIDGAQIATMAVTTDADMRVACLALQSISNPSAAFLGAVPDSFECIAAIYPTWPIKEKVLPAIVWDWFQQTAGQQYLTPILVRHLDKRSPKVLIPYLSAGDVYLRASIMRQISEVQPWDAEIRNALFNLIGDASSWLREETLKKIQGCEIDRAESDHLVNLLTRKSSDLRRGILNLLLKQPDDSSIIAASSLVAAKNVLQRQAGLELLAEMVKQDRGLDRCRTIATEYQSSRGDKLTNPEKLLLNRILAIAAVQPTLKDALGLVDLADLTPAVLPQINRDFELNTTAVKSTLAAIDELIHEHRQTPVQIADWQGEPNEHLLGNLQWQFPSVDRKLSNVENLARLPLSDIWQKWYEGKRAKDADGLELIRAIAPRYVHPLRDQDEEIDSDEEKEFTDATAPYYQLRKIWQTQFSNPQPDLRYPQLVRSVLDWLIYLYPQPNVHSFNLDAITALITTVDAAELEKSLINRNPDMELESYDLATFVEAMRDFAHPQGVVSSAEVQRWWQIANWIENTVWRRFIRWGRAMTCGDVLAVYELNLASKADLVYYLLGDRFPNDTSNLDYYKQPKNRSDFSDLGSYTRRKLSEKDSAILIELAAMCRERILEIECQRGELPTAATAAALGLRSIEGIPTVVKLLIALDTQGFVRGHSYGTQSKAGVMSHLMRISFPAVNDTPGEFTSQMKAAKISEEKLIQLAFFAPQWVNYIQHALQLPGFTEGVWWIHAHTKDGSWSVDVDVRETWVAQISECTPLAAQSLVDGAVDVEWFNRVYAALPAGRWQQLAAAAQYASSGAGHQRAKQFADAMLGNLKITELMGRINSKRHQDSLRALGLCPLNKDRDKDLLDRYQNFQEFIRTGKKFGAQRKASEKLAVEIGLENLARTAGYTDPIRLQWAMEAQAVADLALKPQVITIDETSVSLSITAEGTPEITITKAGKTLKAIPAKLKKDPEIQALTGRKQDIVRQASRMRISLEQAMCRGDAFVAKELQQLAQHPVLAPMLRELVLISVVTNPQQQLEMGYLTTTGTELLSPTGTIKITADQFRIAYPYDLLQTKDWTAWQQDCFAHNRQQPFKQVFRELYVATAGEQTERGSKRYEGHQVNPRQAIALFGQRGWVSSPGDGVRKTFHEEGLIATVTFQNGYYTPLELEGLTIDRLTFHERDQWKSIPLKDISPVIFSEVMRDLDLVVSVAHIGGVDPEASASTVEMRSSILRETIRLMKFSNVQIQGSHALITGTLGTYSVHLGSSIVHRQPGGALCILPVSSQHRGRIFLPFVDDDPKTAEIISKVLLLAKDQDIQDPTILEQILSK